MRTRWGRPSYPPSSSGRSRGAILLALLSLALTGCGGGGTTALTALPSGILGQARITVSPGTVFVGQPPPTPQPYPGAILSILPGGGGKEIARATAGPQGQFKITLSPGTYQVVPVVSTTGPSASVSASTQTVTVPAYQFAYVVVDYFDHSAP